MGSSVIGMDQRAINMEARRQRILDSAERLIMRDSLSAFTMRALAEEVGLSVKTLYNLYGGKEAIASVLEDRAFSSLEAELTALPEDQDPIEQVLTIMTVAAQKAIARKALIHPMWAKDKDRPLGSPSRPLEFMEFGAGLAERALIRALAQKALDARFDPHILASQLAVGWFGTAILWARGALGDEDFVIRVKHTGLCNLLPYADEKMSRAFREEIASLEKQMTPLPKEEGADHTASA